MCILNIIYSVHWYWNATSHPPTGHELEEEKLPAARSGSGLGNLTPHSVAALDPSHLAHRSYFSKIQAEISPQKSPAVSYKMSNVLLSSPESPFFSPHYSILSASFSISFFFFFLAPCPLTFPLPLNRSSPSLSPYSAGASFHQEAWAAGERGYCGEESRDLQPALHQVCYERQALTCTLVLNFKLALIQAKLL